MLQQRRNISGSIITAIIIKTALLTSLSIILLTDSTAPMVRPIDVLAEADDSVDAVAQVYISDDNNDNNEEEETDWSDIEYLRDANNNTMVDYKNLFDLNIGKVYNPNFVDNADWFLDSSNYEDRVDYYLIPYNYDWHFYSKISAPWYGCEAQSKAMLVTAKKYNETGDSEYLEFSKKVFNGLNSPVLNQDGWLLGVVTENNNATLLNSQLFCVANLMTYYEYTGDERALTLFNKSIDVLEKNIGNLSKDCGTYYSLSKDRYVSHKQHPEYIKMLERLYLMTESNTLKNTLDKWQHDYLFSCHS
ncbi:MAG: D-glucuronyl C5-epimerase family protein [Nitrososphaeraceae archaeon]|nr:D-glucuronyl C5-epimerase family protein [Nitrososphaeraceae archaeon]MDW0200541.1 D-glucuronyl C5-epimerase family protein [Nitrososphaeraceae archaeon]MDW0221270.1 D-glucuronyl C5-epimerase family protein [Nitrososphaeraceae archaeon]MDW0227931.1 D-glucuronyl C5-epimerase family protein [Nitrososphaeraceae archaeon]MDW0269080.1 D-glucuronyl C5-epimerase family protein [Nitrososphaeraceae archaeon]